MRTGGSRLPFLAFDKSEYFPIRRLQVSAYSSLVISEQSGAARRTPRAMAQHPYVEVEFSNGTAEGVAVHAQLAGRLTLVAVVLLQYGEDESLLKLADRFRIQNSALMHLQD